MKTWLSVLLFALALQSSGCRKAVFQNIDDTKSNSNADSINGGSGSGDGDGESDAEVKLLVSVPVSELPFGSNTTQATAKLEDGSSPPVTWKVEGVGSIDSSGIYKSPETGSAQSTVKIIATLKSDTSVTGETTLDVVPASKPTLTVTTPSPEIKAGEEKMQATAKLSSQTAAPVVTWTIEGPTGRTENGSIDANGVYTSPKTTAAEFSVTIKATLVSDPTIIGSTSIKVLPVSEEIFTRCTRGSEIFPIVADVYQFKPAYISETHMVIPSFSNSDEAVKKTTVCMDRYAVAPRFFDAGFPDLDSSFIENFALNTKTQIVIPEDGDYIFYLNSDDGSRLYIDGKVVIDHDGLHQAFGTGVDDLANESTAVKKATIKLLKGTHDLRLDYFQGPKYRIALELKWKRPGSTTFEYVPRTSFK